MSTITPIHTACKKCVFADYQNNSQVGCSIGYLEKYRNINAHILEVYDEEKEFYVINEKKCLCYREDSWFEQHDMKNSSLEDKIAKVQETNHLHYLLVVNLLDFSDDDLTQTIKQISELSVKPQKIIFVRYVSNKSFEFKVLSDLLKSSNLNCAWRIQSMIDDSFTYKGILHNIVNLNKGYRFVLSVENPTENLDNMISYADNKIYNELGALHVVSNDNRSATLFSAPSYRFSLLVESKNILEDLEHVTII